MDTLITILIIAIILVGFLSTVRVTELSILPIIVTILLGVACISIELAAFVCFLGVMVFIIWKANENL